MEITIGRNPPGAVTVDLRRVDALTKIHAHELLVRGEFERSQTTRPASIDVPRPTQGATKNAPAGSGAPAYGHLLDVFGTRPAQVSTHAGRFADAPVSTTLPTQPGSPEAVRPAPAAAVTAPVAAAVTAPLAVRIGATGA